MTMKYLIKKYLSDNGCSGELGKDYLLQNNGDGVFISYWNENIIGISKPEFTEQELSNGEVEELLQNAKDEKIKQIIWARKQEQISNITVSDKEYLNTEKAQNKFFHILSATTGNIDWRLANGEWVNLTREEAITVRNAIIIKEKSIYQKESEKIAEIEAIENDGRLAIKTKINRINNIIW